VFGLRGRTFADDSDGGAMSDSLLLIPCPHCGAMNRIPATRAAEAPRCGRCHEAVFAGKPIPLTAAEFDKHAVRSELPLLVDFWAPWCAPCLGMAPEFEAAAKSLEPRLRLAKVDTEAEPALAQRYGIRSIPTLILLHSGREIARQSGAMSSTQIVRWAQAQLPQ
jgi:thioredoxin 2